MHTCNAQSWDIDAQQKCVNKHMIEFMPSIWTANVFKNFLIFFTAKFSLCKNLLAWMAPWTQINLMLDVRLTIFIHFRYAHAWF
jgi:hypothetical protein